LLAWGAWLCDGFGFWAKKHLGRQGRQIGSCDWFAKQPALANVAALPGKQLALLGVLNTFRNRAHAEALAEADDCRHNFAALGGFDHVFNEAAVNLELVKRERLEMQKAGVAGAEIVQSKADAEGL
jgi:hypothetical protein